MLAHEVGHGARAFAQKVFNGHGVHIEIRAGLAPNERVVAVPQQRRELDSAALIHAAQPVSWSVEDGASIGPCP